MRKETRTPDLDYQKCLEDLVTERDKDLAALRARVKELEAQAEYDKQIAICEKERDAAVARARQAEAERDALIRKFSVVLPPVDRGVSNLKEEKTT